MNNFFFLLTLYSFISQARAVYEQFGSFTTLGGKLFLILIGFITNIAFLLTNNSLSFRIFV